MSSDTIKNLSEILGPFLGPNKTIADAAVSRLTPPGENFGSVMLKVDLTINSKDGKQEKLYAVAKKLPETEIFRQVFNIQVTYRNEIAFYDTVLPVIKKFQEENGVKDNLLDCFPKLYGARISLDKTSEGVDEDAVLILENVVASGYISIDRQIGFDLDTTKFIIDNIARFHGTTIALRLKNPKVFNSGIKATCHDYVPPHEFITVCAEVIQDIIAENPKCAHLGPKVTLWGQKTKTKAREPFAAVIHDDLWVNNTLQKFENGKIVGNVFVDFQVYAYRSAVADLFFLLWSSVQLDVLKEHLDFLLQHYFQILTETLERYKCDTKPFDYDTFLEELKIESEFEFGHAMQFGIFVVQGPKGGGVVDKQDQPSKGNILSTVSRKAKERVWYMVTECDKRGWLN